MTITVIQFITWTTERVSIPLTVNKISIIEFGCTIYMKAFKANGMLILTIKHQYWIPRAIKTNGTANETGVC